MGNSIFWMFLWISQRSICDIRFQISLVFFNRCINSIAISSSCNFSTYVKRHQIDSFFGTLYDTKNSYQPIEHSTTSGKAGKNFSFVGKYFHQPNTVIDATSLLVKKYLGRWRFWIKNSVWSGVEIWMTKISKIFPRDYLKWKRWFRNIPFIQAKIEIIILNSL